MRRSDVRSRHSWTVSAFAMSAVLIPGLSMFILAQGTPASPAVPPLPAAPAPARGGGGRGATAAAPAAPTPRFPDGTPRLGSLPGLAGTWSGGGGGNADVPYQPWARGVSNY